MASPIINYPSAVVVINLRRREDRWDAFQAEQLPNLHELEVHRIDAVDGLELEGFGKLPYFKGRKRDRRWAARAGCVLSHRKAIERAKKEDWDSVLILEDDIEVIKELQPLLADVFNHIEKDQPTVLYLGYTDPVTPYQKVAELQGEQSLIRTYGCNTAHAYILNRPTYDWILERLPTENNIWKWLMWNRAIDRWYYRNLSRKAKVYVMGKSVLNQKAGHSDIIGKKVIAACEVHQTSIHKDQCHSKHCYLLLALKRRMQFAVEWIYDGARGVYKRMRGF